MARSNVVVGAGIWGCTLARVLAERGEKVDVFDERTEVGGNCASFFDQETGIEVHRYGSHIFHTDNDDVWSFANRFANFNSYRHRVITFHNGAFYQLPLGLMMINKFFGVELYPCDVEEFMTSDRMKQLDEAFFDNYTRKQWGNCMELVGNAVRKRLPVRTSFDTSYFNDAHQGLPICGYCEMFRKMLDHQNITVHLGYEFDFGDVKCRSKDRIFYSGAIDKLFGYSLGTLKWRSLMFETFTLDKADNQGCAVVNYPDSEYTITRIHEFKHYHPECKAVMDLKKTVITSETPVDWDRDKIPYYPVNCNETALAYGKYISLLKSEYPNVIVGGRLGGYKYLDMDEAMKEALDIGRSVCL